MYDTDKHPKVGDLRVWHVPQIPMKPFHVPVTAVDEARRVIAILAQYDLFQYHNKIKPDYSNASGLEVYEADNGDGVPGWCEWCDAETGDDIRAKDFLTGFFEKPTVDQLVAAMKREILDDIAVLRVPHNVSSFSELHDYVDANCYAGLCSDDNAWAWINGEMPDSVVDLINEATDIVDKWLANGRKD